MLEQDTQDIKIYFKTRNNPLFDFGQKITVYLI